MCVCVLQLRNMGSGLCVESKPSASGSPLRLEPCVKGRGDALWNHAQVTLSLPAHFLSLMFLTHSMNSTDVSKTDTTRGTLRDSFSQLFFCSVPVQTSSLPRDTPPEGKDTVLWSVHDASVVCVKYHSWLLTHSHNKVCVCRCLHLGGGRTSGLEILYTRRKCV